MIQVDVTGFTSPHTEYTVGIDVTYENTSLGGIVAPSCPDWITYQEVGGAEYGNDYVMSYQFTVAENEGGVRYGNIVFECTDRSGETYNNNVSAIQGSGEIIEAPIWKDTYYLARGANLFRYSINYNGVGIYYGKSYSSPGAAGAYVQLNKICGNFLKNNVGDLSQYDDDVVENVGAVGLFSLCNEEGTEVCNYRFLLDYAGDWSGESPYVMTTTINGHIDPRMKALCTIYCDEETEMWWEIDDNAKDWSERPVTFQILTGGTLTITETNDPAPQGSGNHTKWYYKNGVYSDWMFGNVTINVERGDIVELYGLTWEYRGPTISDTDGIVFTDNTIRIGGTCSFNVSGNLMSLSYGADFLGKTEWAVLPPNTSSVIYGYESMCELFVGSNVISAKNLILPITDLTKYNVVSPYAMMFAGCTKLKYPPQLPATTLSPGCYHKMFYNCSKLKKAPDLPAPSISNRCYDMLFYGCYDLNYVKCLATQGINSSDATADWIVSDGGTFVKHPDANNWAITGYYGIPPTWTIINA